jgi:death-on-curing protein
MRFPDIDYVLREQRRIVDDAGGLHGVRDMNLLLSALGQPLQSFGGQDLYPDVNSKAAALGYFLIRNHPFVDGNKRIGHAMMEWVLRANQLEMAKEINNQEKTILAVAAGDWNLEEFTNWLRERVKDA